MVWCCYSCLWLLALLFTIILMIFYKLLAFFFRHPNCQLLFFFMSFLVHLSNVSNVNLFPCNSLWSIFYELCRGFIELFYFLFDMRNNLPGFFNTVFLKSLQVTLGFLPFGLLLWVFTICLIFMYFPFLKLNTCVMHLLGLLHLTTLLS